MYGRAVCTAVPREEGNVEERDRRTDRQTDRQRERERKEKKREKEREEGTNLA